MRLPDSFLPFLESLTQIGAPTFHEERRTDFLLDWIKERVDAPYGRDAAGNVWIDLSRGGDRLTLFDAHIDTVSLEKEISILKEGSVWSAPGIYDNTVSAAILLFWAEQQSQKGPTPFFVSLTTGEEGEGNLYGIREIIRVFGSRLAQACVLDLEISAVSTMGVGSLRYALEWTSPGGHSWNDFGVDNAIALAAHWMTQLAEAFPWQKSLHTWNAGTISGGKGVNVIADSAQLRLDVRSMDPGFLKMFDEWIHRTDSSSYAPAKIKVIGDRPAGQLPKQSPLKEILQLIHRQLGIAFSDHALSTNANALHAAGIPALCTGVAKGGNVHRADEFLEIDSLGIGWEKMHLLGEAFAQL